MTSKAKKPPADTVPAVQVFFMLMDQHGLNDRDVQKAANLPEGAIYNWRRGHRPLVTTLNQALGVFNMELAVRKKGGEHT